MVPLSLVNRSIGIAKNEILVGKSVYVGRKAVAESSKGQEWSLLEQGIIQKNCDYFKPEKSILSLLTSAKIH